MATYSIKELEKLSGIKAHTIRIWEKRHGIIEPRRTATNIRYYSDEDLKKIINVSLLNSHGVKISHIADLDHEQLTKKVLEFTEKKTAADSYINQVILSMIDLDESLFEEQLSILEKKFGMERAIAEVIFPFFDRIGILWQTGNITPAQEHFISNLVRQKLLVAIDKLPIPPKKARTAVLFLPEHELHEIGLLFVYYILKKDGLRVLYLGQMVPYNDLKSIGESHSPEFFITSIITERQPKELQSYINALSRDFPSSSIIATGAGISGKALSFPSNFHIAGNVLKVRDFV